MITISKCLELWLVIISTACGWFQIEPSIRQDIGSILYHITFPADSESGSIINDLKLAGESELSYPADVLVPGICIRYGFRNPIISSMEVYGAANITQPMLRKMKDTDWISVYMSSGSKLSSSRTSSRFRFSYTESENTLHYIQGGIGIDFVPLKQHKNWKFGLCYDFEYFHNEVFGITGWQYGMSDTADTTISISDMPKFHIDTLHDTKVNTYEAFLHKMRIKAELTFFHRNGFSYSLCTMASPLVIGFDEDYHLLRGKKSNAKTYGIDLEPRLMVTKQIGRQIGITLALSGRYFWSKGVSSQIYYKSSREAEAGDRFDDIETNIILYRAFTALYFTYLL